MLVYHIRIFYVYLKQIILSMIKHIIKDNIDKFIINIIKINSILYSKEKQKEQVTEIKNKDLALI